MLLVKVDHIHQPQELVMRHMLSLLEQFVPLVVVEQVELLLDLVEVGQLEMGAVPVVVEVLDQHGVEVVVVLLDIVELVVMLETSKVQVDLAVAAVEEVLMVLQTPQDFRSGKVALEVV